MLSPYRSGAIFFVKSIVADNDVATSVKDKGVTEPCVWLIVIRPDDLIAGKAQPVHRPCPHKRHIEDAEFIVFNADVPMICQ